MGVGRQTIGRSRGGIFEVQSSHTHTRRFTPVFDEDHLVSAGGLPAVMGLAERAGFTGLLKARLTVASPNAPVKVRALVSGMLAGADDIDGMDVLRSGGTAKVLGAVRAPSTLGTHLRSFTHGHTLQLGAINRDLQANLAHLVPTLFGSCVPSSWAPHFRMGKFPTSGVWC